MTLLLVCAPGADRAFTSSLVWKTFKGNLTQLQKNPSSCGHVRMLSPFHSLTLSFQLDYSSGSSGTNTKFPPKCFWNSILMGFPGMSKSAFCIGKTGLQPLSEPLYGYFMLLLFFFEFSSHWQEKISNQHLLPGEIRTILF